MYIFICFNSCMFVKEKYKIYEGLHTCVSPCIVDTYVRVICVYKVNLKYVI